MKDLHRGFASASWPLPADSARAERELDDWSETTAEIDDRSRKAFARRLATTKAGKRLLAAIFGNSPFLAHCLTRDPGFAVDLLRDGPDAAFTQTMRDIGAHFGGPTDTPALMTGLRVAKRRVALAIALADIAGLWPLERVTGALSDFAEAALNLAVRRLLREAAANKALRLPASAQPERHSGFTIIAMGKLGARELNYSSDIDLIALYDSEKIVGDDPDNLQQTFVRLTRGLAKILDERTLDGYVFRTDFRLRPDPASTPLALSMIAAETYYESLGQNWERAAMIKARPIAGDIAAGAAFLDRLRPYVWRKHLDFAAIQDIHSIKRQINAHRGGGTVALAGHNIKIGRGGIREIEFFAQTQQLIWGGRNPTLRAANTCGALAALAEAGRITPDIAQVLTRAYGFLRRVEHRLQMIDDKQTQTLPADAVEMEAFAVFLGFKGAADFGEALLGELRAVEKCYADLFEESPALSGPGNLVFTGTEDDPATLETLAGIGYGEGPTIAGAVRGWHHGRYRATRSVRAREILTELMPALLQAFAKTPEPDAAFIRFDRFLSRLPAGVQLFSLFHSNPGLLDVVAEIMGLAPRLAEVLSARPQMLDAVLAPDFFGPLPGRTALDADLAQLLSQARDFEDVIEIVRRWKNERELQIGVHLLRGRTGIEAAGAHLADVAESAIAALLPAVETEFGRQHGQVPGAAFAVVALGKLGGREMTV
ncbi:MAG: bifunctional [glutamine synthetase] adenylyltransferase/[glutamine synthetase]-adenylyl-L-tyrosine phosphorylase, partial [Rhodospirillales bacterium]|nr:bifunctional [glutamine synthetase] adenylyltransferase/[glutamine synthetase]-adenylyl-L-tyrosine phosphorylase [Rhodospirillales bacterium]